MGSRWKEGAAAWFIVWAACNGEPFPSAPDHVLTSAEAIRAGRAIYQKNCAICHGSEAHGNGPRARSLDPAPADLRSARGVRSEPGYWFFRIREGGKAEPLARPRSAMPAWGAHLSDEEIWQVVAYLNTLVEERG